MVGFRILKSRSDRLGRRSALNYFNRTGSNGICRIDIDNYCIDTIEHHIAHIKRQRKGCVIQCPSVIKPASTFANSDNHTGRVGGRYHKRLQKPIINTIRDQSIKHRTNLNRIVLSVTRERVEETRCYTHSVSLSSSSSTTINVGR